jgi:uncharacterized protein
MGVKDLDMSPEILASLDEVELKYSVHILLAVESGSRAWGFASQDSDYDVRFIYVHPAAWYLSVFEQREVIEPQGEGLLDPSGWDLRKTLRLFAKCNLALNEWLNSPIVYREAEGFRNQLQSLIPIFFNPIAAIHHYVRMASASFDTRAGGTVIRTKKLFYTLRALFACRWVERTTSQPPTEFERLVAFATDDAEKQWITQLIEQKANGHEGDETTLSQQRLETIAAELESFKTYETRAPRPPKPQLDALDTIFRQWVRD